ncbi:Hypothetical protein R9X50_00106600 [Acrodontium crateriforme]|uniref:Uncharacterized protein n=1 Tax=Acrodontium crateriforme TaxID=150365 RepID=A0AAQ3LYF9_9PEZI|nr:Hypothetical protein R9X50_00106600 [Acrodontium crateriforme]
MATLNQDTSTLSVPEPWMSGTLSKDPQNGLEMDGVEAVSRPPSPPETGSNTPTVRVTQCPARLQPIMPPPNYGSVEDSCIFRSAFPQDRNITFLKLLDIKLVLCLVDTLPTETYKLWMSNNNINFSKINIATNKDGQINTTWDSLCEAVLLLMNPANYPIYIHCNQGKHRTGCVVACYRKVKRDPIEDIIAEYEAYAGTKARPGDIDLIRAFDPEAVFEYAKRHGYFADRQFSRKVDSTVYNIDTLVAALTSSDSAMSLDEWGPWDMSVTTGSSVASDLTDEGVEMAHISPIIEGLPMLQRQISSIEQPKILLDATDDPLASSEVGQMEDISPDDLMRSPDSITTITELGDGDRARSPEATTVAHL